MRYHFCHFFAFCSAAAPPIGATHHKERTTSERTTTARTTNVQDNPF
jgi:hypothetical protein